ncbi:endoglucanase 8-like isoform X4 [Euphorbia lathyris]|uniref:endoglucanase 8-like isoform X4 n=1 Tax=Euphorbia lathyris TaxID=212925 RepID=UPI00331334C0
MLSFPPFLRRFLILMVMITGLGLGNCYDYNDALGKSILFFEGQRSGKLPSSQRLRWRKDSALRDGFQIGVDLVGGYYDAGDNVKFNFPMAFSTTMLSWSVVEFGKYMGQEQLNALDAIKWATDYFLKCTSIPGFVYVQVGDPYSDHNCWERPEDMDTLRTTFAASKHFPASEVSAEIAAALASAALAFRPMNRAYSARLLKRARMMLSEDHTMRLLDHGCALFTVITVAMSFAEFGWDNKNAGINVLVSRMLNSSISSSSNPIVRDAERFVCSVLPESPTVSVSYSPGGLLFKPGGSNMQHTTAMSFLLLAYSRVLNQVKRDIHCGNVVATSARLVKLAKTQVDYILGSNPLNMSYMVGYGKKFPQKIHHRGSSLPSVDAHQDRIDCKDGSSYFGSGTPNPNLLVGAVVGGPDVKDGYSDSRADFVHSEPTTYINAPLVGLLAYFRSHP